MKSSTLVNLFVSAILLLTVSSCHKGDPRYEKTEEEVFAARVFEGACTNPVPRISFMFENIPSLSCGLRLIPKRIGDWKSDLNTRFTRGNTG